MLDGWRIVKAKYASQAFDGEGARVNGGRWNTSGTPMVYTAENASLALLEVLVHLKNSSLLTSYVLCAVHFKDSFVKALDRSKLPKDWPRYPPPSELQRIGDEWARSGSSLVLKVPSSITKTESNYLINPLHSDFAKITIDSPKPFEVDLRLLEL